MGDEEGDTDFPFGNILEDEYLSNVLNEDSDLQFDEHDFENMDDEIDESELHSEMGENPELSQTSKSVDEGQEASTHPPSDDEDNGSDQSNSDCDLDDMDGTDVRYSSEEEALVWVPSDESEPDEIEYGSEAEKIFRNNPMIPVSRYITAYGDFGSKVSKMALRDPENPDMARIYSFSYLSVTDHNVFICRCKQRIVASRTFSQFRGPKVMEHDLRPRGKKYCPLVPFYDVFFEFKKLTLLYGFPKDNAKFEKALHSKCDLPGYSKLDQRNWIYGDTDVFGQKTVVFVREKNERHLARKYEIENAVDEEQVIYKCSTCLEDQAQKALLMVYKSPSGIPVAWSCPNEMHSDSCAATNVNDLAEKNRCTINDFPDLDIFKLVPEEDFMFGANGNRRTLIIKLPDEPSLCYEYLVNLAKEKKSTFNNRCTGCNSKYFVAHLYKNSVFAPRVRHDNCQPMSYEAVLQKIDERKGKLPALSIADTEWKGDYRIIPTVPNKYIVRQKGRTFYMKCWQHSHQYYKFVPVDNVFPNLIITETFKCVSCSCIAYVQNTEYKIRCEERHLRNCKVTLWTFKKNKVNKTMFSGSSSIDKNCWVRGYGASGILDKLLIREGTDGTRMYSFKMNNELGAVFTCLCQKPALARTTAGDDNVFVNEKEEHTCKIFSFADKFFLLKKWMLIFGTTPEIQAFLKTELEAGLKNHELDVFYSIPKKCYFTGINYLGKRKAMLVTTEGAENNICRKHFMAETDEDMIDDPNVTTYICAECQAECYLIERRDVRAIVKKHGECCKTESLESVRLQQREYNARFDGFEHQRAVSSDDDRLRLNAEETELIMLDLPDLTEGYKFLPFEDNRNAFKETKVFKCMNCDCPAFVQNFKEDTRFRVRCNEKHTCRLLSEEELGLKQLEHVKEEIIGNFETETTEPTSFVTFVKQEVMEDEGDNEEVEARQMSWNKTNCKSELDEASTSLAGQQITIVKQEANISDNSDEKSTPANNNAKKELNQLVANRALKRLLPADDTNPAVPSLKVPKVEIRTEDESLTCISSTPQIGLKTVVCSLECPEKTDEDQFGNLFHDSI